MIGAAQGFPVTLCMPENVSVERKRILHAYGANIIYTDPADGSDGAIRMARELAAKHPDLYYYADQYSNDANWQAHYHGTANEIWQQTEGRITHFVAMLGHQWNFRWDDAAAEGIESTGSLHFAAAGFGLPRNRRHKAHGQRDRSEDLRCFAGRRGSWHLYRRRLRHGQASGPRRRLAGGNIGGCGSGRLPATGAAVEEKRAVRFS